MCEVQFAPLASDARPAVPVSSPISLDNDIDELALARAQLDQERSSNTVLRGELEQLRARGLDQASSIQDLCGQVNAGSKREESAVHEANLMRIEIESLRNEQVEATEVRAGIDRISARLAQTEMDLKYARESLAEEKKNLTDLDNAHTDLLVEHTQLIEAGPRLQKQHDEACKKAFEMGRDAQQSAHENQVILLEQAHAKHMQEAQEEVSMLTAKVNQGREDLERANNELHECHDKLERFEDTVNTCADTHNVNRKHIEQLESNLIVVRGDLEARNERVHLLEEQLKTLKAEHEGQLEAARIEQEEQDSRLYGAEVQLQNSHSTSERELHQMQMEMTKLRDVVARSASDADFVLSGRQLTHGKYMALHTAVQSEYGIETYTRWFVEEDAAQVVEALGLRSTAYCAKYSLAFAPEWRLIPDSTKTDAEGFANLWKREGDLWRWGKSIDETVRNFIDSLKRSAMPRGTKRQRDAVPFHKSTRRVEPLLQIQGSTKQRQALEGQKQLEGRSARLAIEAPPSTEG